MIAGQKSLLDNLKSVCANDRASHLYIFEGERGMGKSTISSYFAKLLICDSASGCGVCDSCKTFESLAHPDVILVSETEKAEIGVDAVRNLIKEVYLKPQLSKKRVFIIKDAHKLNKSAQNALLKVIEEPPSYAVFMLLCENAALLLNTILSRGVRIKIPSLDAQSLKSILKTDAGDKTDFYISYCGGNPGRLIEISSDDEFYGIREQVTDGIKYLLADKYGIYKLLKIFEELKDKKTVVFNVIESFFRDILLIKLGKTEYIINSDKKDYLNKLAVKISKAACLEVIDIIEKTNNNMGKYGNYPLMIQTMLMECWEAING